MLILDIFAQHAVTKEGKIQVELAQLKYQSTRLIGMGIALSRLGGGIGTRGPGEKKLEMDRRLIRNRISQLNKELEQVKAYVEIEKARFGDKLTVLYDIDENIDAKIPSLTIQPLVENAIIHGIRKNGGCGTVIIGVKKEDGYTRVWVENDGITIDLDIIKKVYSGEMPGNKIGLYNVHLRLKLIYGQGLNIYRLEPGTKMEFYI